MKKRLLIICLALVLLAAALLAVITFTDVDFPLVREPEASTADTAIGGTSPSGPDDMTVDYFYRAIQEGIVSYYYHIDREKSFITGIAPQTSTQKLLNTCMPANAALSHDALCTGTVIYVPTEEGGRIHSLTVIVTGDLNGDGAVSMRDLQMLKDAVLGQQLSDKAAAAADVNYDGEITDADVLLMESVVQGQKEIAVGHPLGAQPKEPILLLTPGSSEKWSIDAGAGLTYVSGDETLVTVDAEGNVTALDREGSAFVYALTENNQLVSRVLVTVLAETMEVTLDQSAVTMLPGGEETLSVSFNHPFSRAVTWSSSNPETVSVNENGELKALKVGTAVISASLENGSISKAEVTVELPITAIEIEKALYKIKPGSSKALEVITDPLDSMEEFIWESSDPAIATVDGNGVVTGVDYGTATITVTGKSSGLTASCQVKICDVKQIALTFDDGPSEHTAKLLDYLKEHDIKVTFFLIGRQLKYFKEELIREVEEGHEIGYHSYAHKNQMRLSTAEIKSDFEKSNEILKEITGAEFTLWRTPGGNYNERVLNAVELPHIMWWLDTFDWKSLNAQSVCARILTASDGSIVLIHDLHKTSVEGAILALEQMIDGDYEFLTVTELLSRDGTPPENCVSYNSGKN